VTPNLRDARRPRLPVPADTWKPVTMVEDMRTAVFASMDIPPLFKYALIGDDYYEDGGVIDNLPIRFGTEIEECDLLFVLPLNATFEEEVNLQSVFKRLSRVMEVRQGVLERNSFKMLYLYNELAGLRRAAQSHEESLKEYRSVVKDIHRKLHDPGDWAETRIEALKGILEEMIPSDIRLRLDSEIHDPAATSGESRADRVLHREHTMVQVFSICPAPELAINTTEFWKTKEAGKAFRLMYECTRSELQKYDFTAEPGWIRMALVSPHGQVTYLEDF
jgi:predicted acylesterase/phospholipase RssA